MVTAIDKASDVMETIALCPTTRTGGTIRGSDPDHAPGNFDICHNNFEPPLDTTIRYRYEGTKNLPFGEPDHGPCDNGHEFDLSRLPAMKAGNRFASKRRRTRGFICAASRSPWPPVRKSRQAPG